MMEQIKRQLARLKRGDGWRWVVTRARRLRYGNSGMYAQVGPVRSPHRALITRDADLHAWREHSILAVLALLGDTPTAVRPARDRQPWVVSVPDKFAEQSVERLQALPPHWELIQGHPLVLVPQIAASPESALTSPELRVEIRAEEGLDGRIREVRPARAWKTDVDRWLTPLWPIDLVYTWVDGDDAAWRARRDAELAHATRSPGPPPSSHPNSTDNVRFINTNELRYSLRSVYQFANWVRRIYIVTDNQVPAWLNPEHPKVTVVDHRDILPRGTFNSHAIESALHRIPGLSEHYLYLNDDVFFGRMAYPDDYFDEAGRAKFFPSELSIPAGPATADDKPIIAAAKNGRDVIQRRFGYEITQRLRHSVHAQRRSVIEQMEHDLPEDFARLARTPFRSPQDLSVAAALHHWYGQALGKAVPAETNYLYVNITDEGTGQILDALASLKRYDVFCLNQEESQPHTKTAQAELKGFLEDYFPLPAPWEI